jgi:hypothetical protein
MVEVDNASLRCYQGDFYSSIAMLVKKRITRKANALNINHTSAGLDDSVKSPEYCNWLDQGGLREHGRQDRGHAETHEV